MDAVADDWNLLADERRFRESPLTFIRELKRTMGGEDFAAYNDYIGSPLFTPTPWFERIRELTMKQPVVVATVDRMLDEQAAREADWDLTPAEREARRDRHREWLHGMLKKIADQALPRFRRLPAVRFEYFIVSQFLSRCYKQGLHISRSDIARLKKQAVELQAKKQSMVLFPCHKSHVDYTALVYTFFRIGLSMPVTIAGDNLALPVLSYFLREVGATFIRRGNWKQDPLYTAFFQGLMNTYLQEGCNLQCFIEGTRSRTGKLLPPKFGILKFILEAVMSGAVDDCWIVPVSTQYDKVVEADTYATELMGTEKKKESFKSFLDSRSIASLNLGRVDIRFGQGWSLKQFVAEQLGLNAPRIHILRTLGYNVLGAINQTSVVMPSSLVGAVLLTTRRRGLSHEDLVYRVRLLIDRVVGHGGRVGAITKPESELTTADIDLMVSTAIDVLGSDLVLIESKRVLEKVYSARDEFKLSYYRNQVMHLFVPEALISVCLYEMYVATLSLEQPFQELERRVKFLSELLSGEFVYSTAGLEKNMRETLAHLHALGIITAYSADSVEISLEEVRNEWVLTHNYTYLLWPYIDGYWSTALTLCALPPYTSMNYKRFLVLAQSVANTLYSEGALTHVEASNQEIIRSALAHYESIGLVQREDLAIRVNPEFSGLSDLCDEISEYRNEVMKRPKGSDVQERVLELCKPSVEVAKL